MVTDKAIKFNSHEEHEEAMELGVFTSRCTRNFVYPHIRWYVGCEEQYVHNKNLSHVLWQDFKKGLGDV